MKYSGIILFITLYTLVTYGQKETSYADIQKINERYDKIDKVSMKMDYRVYNNWNTEIPIQSEKGVFKKDNNATYTKIGHMESLNTRNYYVVVDHESKSIAIMPIYRSEEPIPDITSMTSNISKILDLCDSVGQEQLNKEQNKYTLILPAGALEYSKVEIVYNRYTYFIDKMTLYYKQVQNLEGDEDGIKETPRIEITYHDESTDLKFTSTTFTFERFLHKKGDKFFCNEQYSDYELIDQMN